MIIDVAIMAHPARVDAARHLAEQTGARIVWDDGHGEWDTGARAWDSINRDADWGLILQDDAQPIPDMLTHLTEALAHTPPTCISLYVGTGVPRGPAVTNATQRATLAGNAWLTTRKLLWGVALAQPTTHITPLLQWATTSPLPYDQRIGAWYAHRGHPIRYTWPSLVNHADTPTLVTRTGGPVTVPRRAHHVGAPPTWDTDATTF
jgi:hypothetical protein